MQSPNLQAQNKVREKRIAILPFRDQIMDKQVSPLIPGFIEDLVTNLSSFTGISVISYFSTAHLKDPVDPEKLKRLNADYLIKGSFRKRKDHIRISFHLINASNEQIVYAKDYDFIPNEIVDTQDEILRQIVSSLQQKIDFDILSHSYRKKNGGSSSI